MGASCLKQRDCLPLTKMHQSFEFSNGRTYLQAPWLAYFHTNLVCVMDECRRYWDSYITQLSTFAFTACRYVCRLISCPKLIPFLTSTLNAIDLVAIVPFFVELIFVVCSNIDLFYRCNLATWGASFCLSYLILLILHYICHYSCYKIKNTTRPHHDSGQITHPLEKLLKTIYSYTLSVTAVPVFSSFFFTSSSVCFLSFLFFSFQFYPLLFLVTDT